MPKTSRYPTSQSAAVIQRRRGFGRLTLREALGTPRSSGRCLRGGSGWGTFETWVGSRLRSLLGHQ